MMVVMIITQFIMLVIFLYCIYILSMNKGNMKFYKWLMVLSSFGILFIADKIKLLLWVVVICGIWLIKHKKQQDDELA